MMDQLQFHYSIHPVVFAQDILEFHPDPVQATILDSTATRGIICCTRQWGKSTITAAKAVHTACFRRGSLVLVAAPSARQSAELVRKCAEFLSLAGYKRRGDGQNHVSLLLPNGSRIVGLPNAEDTIRGFSAPALILIDEAARVPDALYHALLPMLATNPAAGLWMMSTPNGRHGFFFHEWTSDNGFTKISVTAYDCPRIPSSFIEAQALRLPSHVFEQEYLCVFHSSSDALISEEDLDAAFDSTLEPIL